MATTRWTDGGADGDWTNTANWSAAAVPANGDDVYIETSSRAIDTNLNQSAVALNSLNISKRFTGTIGTLDTALQIGAADVRIGYDTGIGSGAGSTRLHIDLGSTTAAQVLIEGSASSSADAGLNPVRIRAANAATDVQVRGGRVSIADRPGESATLGDVNMSAGNVQLGHVNADSAVTYTNLVVSGGNLVAHSMPTNVTSRGGTSHLEGGGAITDLTCRGGTVVSNTAGTIAAVNAFAGLVDFLQSTQVRTATDITVAPGGRVQYRSDVLTVTNGIQAEANREIQVFAAEA